MKLDGARIAVIGGAGLIGSHIVDQLGQTDAKEIIVIDNFARGTRANLAPALENFRNVTVREMSITDRQAVTRELQGIDGVFLLSALWLGECVADPRSALEVNVMGTWNVIEGCLANKVKRVVFSSSASVYGDAVVVPMTEEHPFNNRTTYGATKIAGEQLFRAMNEQHKLQYAGMRYMNVYGPRMDYKGTYVSVIMKVLDRIKQGQPPVIFGDGSQSYDFIHVVDVARANVLAMQAEASDEFFNIGMGVRTTINELVEHLLELTGSNLKPEYRPQEQMFVPHLMCIRDKA